MKTLFFIFNNLFNKILLFFYFWIEVNHDFPNNRH